jgi:hypothetical protein
MRSFSVKGPAADATDAPQPWGLLCNPVMKTISFFPFVRVMEHQWYEIDRLKPVSVPLCPPKNLIWKDLRSNPGLRSGKPATNRLSYSTTHKRCLLWQHSNKNQCCFWCLDRKYLHVILWRFSWFNTLNFRPLYTLSVHTNGRPSVCQSVDIRYLPVKRLPTRCSAANRFGPAGLTYCRSHLCHRCV